MSYSQAGDKEYSEKLQKADAVFYGEVISIEAASATNKQTQKLEVKVLRSWKGIEAEKVFLSYDRAYTTFEKEIGNTGMKKVFYAGRRNDDSNLFVDFCSFSSFDDERTKREFGEGKTFEARGKEIQTGESSENFPSIIRQIIISFFS